MVDINALFLFFLHSLKLECEKLASEKIEIQRHYVMVSRGEERDEKGRALHVTRSTYTHVHIQSHMLNPHEIILPLFPD